MYVLNTTFEEVAVRTVVFDENILAYKLTAGSTVDVVGKTSAMEAQLAELKQAVDALKLTDEQKQKIWLADRPPDKSIPMITYRPRTDRRSEQEGTKQSLADIATGTLATIPK